MPQFYPGCNRSEIASKNHYKKIIFAAVLLLLFNARTIAQVQWTDAGSATNWNDPTNWTPNTLYSAWLPTSIAQFNNTGTAVTAGIDMSQGSLSIGALMTSGRSRDLTIGNSSGTPGTLTLNGTPNIIISSASSNGSTLYIQDNETGTGKTMNLALGNSYNVIKPGFNAPIVIGSSISGSGELVVSGNSSGYYVELSGANTYTGLTSVAVRMGIVVLSHPGGGTLPATNDVSVTDGTLRINSDQTLHNLTISGIPGCNVRVADGVTLTITGTLTDGGPAGCISVTGSGKVVYTPGATLKYSGGKALNTTSSEFPAIDGPTNLTISSTAPYINLHESRSITGSLTLVYAGDMIKLGVNNLTFGTIEAIVGSRVITDGTGLLIASNVGASPVTFPVAAVFNSPAHNTVTIANGGGIAYGVRVKDGIDAALSFPDANTAVNRTWIIERASTPLLPVDISFAYANTEGNAGFNYTNPLKLSQYNGSGWTTVQNNLPQVQPVAATTATAMTPVSGSAFVLSNSSASGSTIQWTESGTATDWNTAANWTVNTAYNAWQPTDIAQFNNTGTATTAGIDMNAGSLSIGALVINTRDKDLAIGNSSATAGTLTLNGATVGGTPNVILSAGGPIPPASFKSYLQDNETGIGKTMNIALGNTTDNIVRVSQFGTLEISSSISGAGKKISLLGANSFPSTLILSGTNTYTGLTTMSSKLGQFILARPGGGTLPATNDVVIGEGRMVVNSDQTLHNISVGGLPGSGISVADGVTLTITGTFKYGNPGALFLAGSGKVVYAPGATLEYNSSNGATTSSKEFPTVDGPTHLKISTAVSLHEPRVITGTLNVTTGVLILNATDFTAAAINAGTGRVVTNNTGRLIVSNVGTGPVLFPVSPTTGGSSNGVTITNGQGLSYAVGVKTGISPAIVNSNSAVNRTWMIKPSVVPGSPVNVSFAYGNGDANPGFSFVAPVELGQYTTAWNVIQPGIVQTQPVATTISTFTGSVEDPFIITNSGAVLASTSVDFNAVKQNDKGHLTWAIENTATLKQLQIERSSDGRNFISLATVATTSIYFDDNQLLPATNYYRLKMTDVNGKVTYSIIIALINSKTGFDMVSILPTVVNSNATLNVTTAQKTKMDVVISDASGKKVQHLNYTLRSGSNQLVLNLASLTPGVYMISGYNDEGISKTIRFVKQ